MSSGPRAEAPAPLRTIAAWGEMIKFSHSVFALPFALLATFLAAQPARPSWLQVTLIAGAMVAARSAAMTFNRLVDRAWDASNPRTAGRALPAGRISQASAWGFFGVTSALFLAVCAAFQVWLNNSWPLLLGVPVLAYLCFYSYTKRFTRASHLVLGSGIALAPVAAWIAISPETLGAPALWLMTAVATWISGFDIIYSCLDVEFDRSSGLYSLPSRIGIAAALWVARGLHVVTVAALVLAGRSAGLGAWYFAGVVCTAVLLLFENAIVSSRDLSRVNLAFFTFNGVVGLLLGFLGICDILLA